MRIALGLMLACSIAHADELRTARDQPLHEVSHTVDITLANGTATYKVRRQFANPGKVSDEAALSIDLPYGAAATGLRIKAHDKWYEGDLMEAEAAAKLYQELTGVGPFAPKDPALLRWLWADKLELRVFPVMPHGISTVEYTLTVPTRYANGKYVLSYPRTNAEAMKQLVTPVITVHADGALALDGGPLVANKPTALIPPPRDELATDPAAGYAVSKLVIAASSHTDQEFTKARVDVDIRHTYRGDLALELVTPDGARLSLFDHNGSGANNVHDHFDVELPPGTRGAGMWRLVASDHVALDTGSLESWKLTLGATSAKSADVPKFIPDAPESPGDAGVASITVSPKPFVTWLGRLGRVVASPEHAFARLELDVAAQLVPLPKQAQVVFVVDASYSAGEEFLQSELAMVQAYLQHVPDAEVELVAVRRHPQRVFGRFVRGSDLKKLLPAIALGNGSNLEEGAALAAQLLADRKGPTRVVLASDELFREALTPALAEAALAKLSPSTIVHVVRPTLDGDDVVSLLRKDDEPFAPLATHHHGIYAQLSGLPAKDGIKALAPPVLELVRPTRIEKVVVTGGFKLDDTTLVEGSGLRLMEVRTDAPERAVLSGVMWSDPVKLELATDAKFSRETAAFVFGADEYGQLSNEEQLKVAFMGHAVSPVTSFVAAEPGTRPSIDGMGWGTIGAGRYGTIGHGSGSGSGYGMARVQPKIHVDPAACLAQFPPPTGVWTAHLVVETTRTEIVDVRGASDPLSTCLAETIWTQRLGGEFDRDHDSFEVNF